MIKVQVIDSFTLIDVEGIGQAKVAKLRTVHDIKSGKLLRINAGQANDMDNPNIEIVECVISAETLAAIKADPDYGDAAILSEVQL
jgi:hypothetical protein